MTPGDIGDEYVDDDGVRYRYDGHSWVIVEEPADPQRDAALADLRERTDRLQAEVEAQVPMTPERPSGLPEAFEWDAVEGAWTVVIEDEHVFVRPTGNVDLPWDAAIGYTAWGEEGTTPVEALRRLADRVDDAGKIVRAKADANGRLVAALRSLVEPEEDATDPVRKILDSWGITEDGPYVELVELLRPDLAAEVERLRAEVERREKEGSSTCDEDRGDETVTALLKQVERLRVERDEAREALQATVAKVAENRLEGYRDLGARAANAETQRDEAVSWRKANEQHLESVKLERDHAQQVEVPAAIERAEEAERQRDRLREAVEKLRVLEKTLRSDFASVRSSDLLALRELAAEVSGE